MSIGVIVEVWFRPDTDGTARATAVFQERLPSVTRTYDEGRL